MEPKRILVVDDDHFNRALMREICESAGYQVFEADDDEKAMELAKTIQPHLVLLDILMGTKDGFQICAALRAEPATAETPVILVTAVDDLDSKVHGMEIGADDYVTKPFRVFDLQTRIRSVLDNRELLRRAREVESHQPKASKPERLRVGGYRQLRWDLDYEFGRASRYGRPISAAILVIEQFEALYAGNLKREAASFVAAVVNRLQRDLRGTDRIYRIEDDTFIVLMPETAATEAQIPLDRVSAALRLREASTVGPVAIATALVSYPETPFEAAQDILRHLAEQVEGSRATPKALPTAALDPAPTPSQGK